MFEQVRVQGNGYRIALLTMITLSQKMRTTGTNASAQNGRRDLAEMVASGGIEPFCLQ